MRCTLGMLLVLGAAAVSCGGGPGNVPLGAAADSGQRELSGRAATGGMGTAGDPASALAAAGVAGMAPCNAPGMSLITASMPLSAAGPLQLQDGVALTGDGLAQTLMAQQNPSAGLRWQLDRLFMLSDAGFWEIPASGPARWYGTGTVIVWGVRAGDFDGDGDLDLLVLSMSLNIGAAATESDVDAGPGGTPSPLRSRLTVWERTPDGLSERAELLSVAAMSFPMPYALGDIDADGDLDVVTFERGTALTYRNSGGFKFTREVLSEAAPGSESFGALFVDLADRDHDGLLDLLVIGGDPLKSPLENTMFVMLGQDQGRFAAAGPGTTGKAPLVPHGPDGIGIGIADVTGDGLADVIMQDPAAPSGIMRLHKSLSATELAPAVEVSGLGFAFADVDADGRTDIVTTRDRQLQALLSRPTGEFEVRDLGLNTASTSTLRFVVDPGHAGAVPVLHALRQPPSCQ